MKITLKFLLIIVLSFQSLIAQDNPLKFLTTKYESLEFRDVIRLSDKLLNEIEQYDEGDKLNVYTMRGISFYSLGQPDYSRDAFIELLKINNDFQLDPSKVSPKIIIFFNQIKKDYTAILNGFPSENEQLPKKSSISEMEIRSLEKTLIQHSAIRSLLLPGWGHLYIDDSKGPWITAAGTAALGSMFYFIYDTNRKENDYLKQVNPELISQKYNIYNKSYKIRNTLIITYAVIWLYSQIDLLFFSDDQISNKLNTIIQTNFISCYPSAIEVSFQINF